MKTNKDYTVNFKTFGEITVPAGTRLTHKTASGIDARYNFVDEFDWIDNKYPKIANTLRMDAINYGIDVPKEFVEE